jgi:hypothetical protein
MARDKNGRNSRDSRRNQGRSKGTRFFFSILMLIALGVFAFSLYQIVTTLLPYHQGRQMNQQLVDSFTFVELVEGEEESPNTDSAPTRDRIRF